MDKKDNQNNIFGDISFFTTSGTKQDNVHKNDVPVSNTIKKSKYINDFDSDLILENIDKKAKNKAVKLNLKINAINRTLSKIDEELGVIQLLNLPKDKERREELSQLKNFLEHKRDKLKRESRKFGILYSVICFFEEKIDFSVFKSAYKRLSDEVKKYDKIALSYIKSKNPDLLPFKW